MLTFFNLQYVFHHPVLFSTGQFSRIPSADAAGKYQGNLGRSLKHLWKRISTLRISSNRRYLPYDPPLQFRRIATGSANAIFAGVQLFIAFFGFFPTYELGEKTEGQGKPLLLCESDKR